MLSHEIDNSATFLARIFCIHLFPLLLRPSSGKCTPRQNLAGTIAWFMDFAFCFERKQHATDSLNKEHFHVGRSRSYTCRPQPWQAVCERFAIFVQPAQSPNDRRTCCPDKAYRQPLWHTTPYLRWQRAHCEPKCNGNAVPTTPASGSGVATRWASLSYTTDPSTIHRTRVFKRGDRKSCISRSPRTRIVTLGQTRLAESTKRTKLLDYIRSLNSRQETTPLLGPLVDKIFAEPLHNSNNACQQLHEFMLVHANDKSKLAPRH